MGCASTPPNSHHNAPHTLWPPELRRAMKNLCKELTAEDIDAMIRICNKDINGYIAPAEVRRLHRNGYITIAKLTNADVDKIIKETLCRSPKPQPKPSPPKPKPAPVQRQASVSAGSYSCGSYGGGCFDGDAQVLMANGSRKAIREVKVGDRVRSFPHSVSTVECVVEWRTDSETKMVRLKDNGWVTHKHPLLVGMKEERDYSALKRLDDVELEGYGLKWVFPKDVGVVETRHQSSVHSLMLHVDSHHNINVSGSWGCTLGDGYKGEVIGHPLWSNRRAVQEYLKRDGASSDYPNVVFV